MAGKKHPLLRKIQDEDGVSGHVVPIDQLIDHIVVCFERQDPGNHINGKSLLFTELRNLLDIAIIAEGVRLVIC